jgi:F0F1-type ATP synthase assembly protein I
MGGCHRKLLLSRVLWLKAGSWPSVHRTRCARYPVTNPSDDRSPAAKAYQWATRIMIVSLEMVLPGLAGYWVDQRLGTVCLFLVVGLALGCSAAVVHLVQLTRADSAKPNVPIPPAGGERPR